MKALLVILAALAVTQAEVGVSLSLAYLDSLPGVDTFRCLRAAGYEFAVIGVIDPCTGTLLPSASPTISSARKAGFTSVDAFLNPCMPCMNGTNQADATWLGIGHKVDFIWVGEYSGCANPSNNFDWNHQFVSSIVDALDKADAKVGINGEMWGYIMGTWEGLKQYPVWYGGNSQLSFSDFQAFGGWTVPAMKTTGTGQACNLTVSFTYRS